MVYSGPDLLFSQVYNGVTPLSSGRLLLIYTGVGEIRIKPFTQSLPNTLPNLSDSSIKKKILLGFSDKCLLIFHSSFLLSRRENCQIQNRAIPLGVTDVDGFQTVLSISHRNDFSAAWEKCNS